MMNSDQLRWLHRNAGYVEAVERNFSASNELSDLLESISWLPRTLEEKEALEMQTAKWKAAQSAVKELRRTLLAQYLPKGRGTKDIR
jgi:hypothetical protein